VLLDPFCSSGYDVDEDVVDEDNGDSEESKDGADSKDSEDNSKTRRRRDCGGK
jgi:hypothetical protein